MYIFPVADDCGVSESNTRDILECLDAGTLKGTSLLANGAFVEQAAKELAKRLKNDTSLCAGFHLNLLEGSCTSHPSSIPLLADESGAFRHSLGSLCRTLALATSSQKTEMLGQIEKEWLAQTTRIQEILNDAAGKETRCYLDGHQHVHAVPWLVPALENVLKTVKVRHVRVPVEPRYYCPGPSMLHVVGNLRRELLRAWGGRLRRMLVKNGVAGPAIFLGGFCSGSMTGERLAAGLAKARTLAKNEDMVEVMFHPGGASQTELAALYGERSDIFSAFYTAPERRVEKELLLSAEASSLFAAYQA